MIPLNLAELTTVSRAQNNILKNDTHVGAAFSQPGSRRPSDYKKIPPNAEALSDLEESPSPASGCRSIQTRLDRLCVSTHSLSLPGSWPYLGRPHSMHLQEQPGEARPNHYIMELSTRENKIPFYRPNIWRSAIHTRKKNHRQEGFP